MNPLVLIKPINMTPEQGDQVTQTEVDSLEDAITIFNNTDTNVKVCDILVWKGIENGYITYASTDGMPLPDPPPEE
jgi:hypothetical protein